MSTGTYERSASAVAFMRGGVIALGLVLAACSEPQPRTFADFIEDRMVMEGTLARCNADRDATLHDLECANARRAASALALRIEQQRSADLERESERKLADLRAQLARREQAEREALAAAEAARQAAYEAQWAIGVAAAAAGEGAPLPSGDPLRPGELRVPDPLALESLSADAPAP